MMKKLLLLLTLIFIVVISFAQKLNGWCATGIEQSSTTEIRNTVLGTTGSISNLINPNGQIIIPVVFHVLWNTQEQQIDPSLIISQVQRLNTDFARQNTDLGQIPTVWQSLAADVKVSFKLACIDPNGNPTNGIIYKSTPMTSYSALHHPKLEQFGGDNAWPTNKYLNIWICNIDDYLGHATYPWLYNGSTNGIPNSLLDGIILHYTVVGDDNGHSTKNLGRVGVHEAAHWLGLWHLFERHAPQYPNGCNILGDEVDDTPIQQSQNFTATCPTFPHFSCPSQPYGDMFMNYMDYTPDFCMFLFTEGQKTRMRSFIATAGPDSRFPFLINYFSIKKIH